LACFKIAEYFVIGRIHGRSCQGSISDLGGWTWKGILTLAALVFVMLIPLFGFTELRRVFGADRLFEASSGRDISTISICFPLEPDKRQAEWQFTVLARTLLH